MNEETGQARCHPKRVTTLLTFAVLLWTAPVTAQPTPPVLAFTDIVAGPKTGNRDTSQGQRAGVDGAIVTVWGFNLVGATFTINGAAPAAIYYVGNAVPPACGAANLFNGYHRLQCAILQVSHFATSGAGAIVATAGGFNSNSLAFTVHAGKIYFAAPSGGDFTGIQAGLNALASGDILYVKNGVSATSGVTVPASSVSPTRPIAVVVYPGAASQVGDATHDAFTIVNSGAGQQMTYAKFSVYNGAASGTAIFLQSNSRMAGNKVQGPNGIGATGCVSGRGNTLAYLGNEFTSCGGDSSDSLYHVLYIAGYRGMGAGNATGESNREVGWNYFHDNNGFRAINIYNENQGAGANWISGHKVHDNVIVNQNGTGIGLLVGTVGENWVYNNLLINTGQSPTPGTEGAGIYLHGFDPGGGETSGLPLLMHVFNNTLLNSSDRNAGSSTRGAIYFAYAGTLDMRNNIIYQPNGLPYVASGSTTTPTAGDGQSSKNLWFGSGAAPRFDSSPVTTNARILSATAPYNLHLQASSPAIGAGVTTASFAPRDFDGIPRPASAASDIGAYQFTGAAGSREN